MHPLTPTMIAYRPHSGLEQNATEAEHQVPSGPLHGDVVPLTNVLSVCRSAYPTRPTLA